MKIIILAAGRGSRMGKQTSDKPKCLSIFQGKTLLERCLENCISSIGNNDVIIVGGYRIEMLYPFHERILQNSSWNSTNIMGSLMVADAFLTDEDCIVVYSDIIFDRKDLESLVSSPRPAVLSVSNWRTVWGKRFPEPLADLESFRKSADGNRLAEIGGRSKDLDSIEGQFGGIFSMTPQVWVQLKSSVANLEGLDSTAALEQLLALGVQINVVETKGLWAEFDTYSDLVTQGSQLED